MLILAIDCASSVCRVCVWQDGQILAEKSEHMERGQDQRLMPLILDAMQQSSKDFNDLDRIAVTRGPGSFTGLRIGLAAARGVGFAAKKPVIGIDRFNIYREHVKQSDKNLLVVIESKRKELFCKFYPAKGEVQQATMLTQEEIAAFLKANPETTLTGDRESDFNEAVICAQLAAQAASEDPQFLPRPLYLRAPDVTIREEIKCQTSQ